MTEKFIVIVLLAVGALNALPAVGLISAERLQALYGLDIGDDGLLLLMRHRALLFALLGGFVLASVFVRDWRLPAMAAALASMLGYLALGWPAETLGPALRKVFWIDAALCLALLPALVLQWLCPEQSA